MSGLTVIVPVKPWRLSKSRLEVSPEAREQLARAFTLDVLAAVTDSTDLEQLVIVTAEQGLGRIARGLGAALLRDRPMLHSDGLSGALDSAAWWSAKQRANAPVVVVPADLPALTGSSFDATIDLMQGEGATFVPDAAGSGTTLYWAPSPRDLTFRYGPSSAFEHAQLGARALTQVDARARWDVDTIVDLVEVRRLGVGAHTSAELEAIRQVEHRPELA